MTTNLQREKKCKYCGVTMKLDADSVVNTCGECWKKHHPTPPTDTTVEKRYKVYYKNKFDMNDDLVLYSDCHANSEKEARENTLKYLNEMCVITKIEEVQNEKQN